MPNVTSLSAHKLDLMDQIKEWIKNPPENSRVITFTPKVAAEILGIGTDTAGLNSHNRAKKPAKVKEYTTDMIDGLWKMTGDTIKFTTGGALGDGQNRLYACVRAKKSFKSHAVFGIDDAVFPWLDKGRQRSIGDDFFVDGMENPQLLAHTMRWLEMFRRGEVTGRVSYTRAEVREAYFNQGYDHELITEAMERGLAVQKATATPRSLASALYYLFAKKNKKLADEFFDAWSSGTHPGRMAPIAKANKTFANIVKNNPLVRIHDTMRAAVWVIAWNFVVKNAKGTMPDFKWTALDPFPKING